MSSSHFHEKHQAFLNAHISQRSGERKGRLERGHQHAEALFLEQVWFPLIGHFEHLHPEYEIIDWRGRSYFGDFAYLPGEVKFIWEIKGFGPHVQDMDRKRYCEELNREIFLQALDFRVVSFAYDDVAHRPERMGTSHSAGTQFGVPGSQVSISFVNMLALAVSAVFQHGYEAIPSSFPTQRIVGSPPKLILSTASYM